MYRRFIYLKEIYFVECIWDIVFLVMGYCVNLVFMFCFKFMVLIREKGKEECGNKI